MNAWFNTYRLAIEAGVAALLIAGGLYWHHRIYESGVASVQQADAVALADAKATAKSETARLAQKAEDASHAHDKELTDLRTYRADHPVHIRVCNNPNNSLLAVPASSATDGGNAGASAATGDLQPVPAGDSSGRDIGPLLEALAAAADAVSSELREYQAR